VQPRVSMLSVAVRGRPTGDTAASVSKTLSDLLFSERGGSVAAGIARLFEPRRSRLTDRLAACKVGFTSCKYESIAGLLPGAFSMTSVKPHAVDRLRIFTNEVGTNVRGGVTKTLHWTQKNE
jgi:hypothetical protein